MTIKEHKELFQPFHFTTRAERRAMERRNMKARKQRIGAEQRAQGAVKFNRVVFCKGI